MAIKGDLATLIDEMFKQNATWPELIKRVRAESAVGAESAVDIFTAQKIALSHQGWRRLCEHMIKHDQECKKQAAYHVKYHGPHSLITMIEGRFVIKLEED
ncbi:hypothetical protein IHQ71_24000 [Rhizobium sp. TH2]|uniref:hypothetical protein n=1 Tax=Rhizobium sp. TH2 TaxID=2775403 RepID=UPI0021588CD8|nr:hypothetical protein [Rhizobium sp. TH2]UVC08187.1 hypothetical protein IHQ71_24000 [Rhizobium sp. TH2]